MARSAAGNMRAGAIQTAELMLPNPSDDRCARSWFRFVRVDSGTEKLTTHQPSESSAGCRACQMILSPTARDSNASAVRK